MAWSLVTDTMPCRMHIGSVTFGSTPSDVDNLRTGHVILHQCPWFIGPIHIYESYSRLNAQPQPEVSLALPEQ